MSSTIIKTVWDNLNDTPYTWEAKSWSHFYYLTLKYGYEIIPDAHKSLSRVFGLIIKAFT